MNNFGKKVAVILVTNTVVLFLFGPFFTAGAALLGCVVGIGSGIIVDALETSK